WNAATGTLTAGEATVVLGNGVTNPSYKAVTVSVARPMALAFSGMLGGVAARTVNATGVAEAWNLPSGSAGSGTCVLAMHASAKAAIKVDNMGRITAPGCDIFANSSAAGTGANAAIYLNSGTLNGASIS